MIRIFSTGKEMEEQKTNMEVCYGLKSPVDEEYEKKKKAELAEAYEKSLEPTYRVPPHGIMTTEKPCPIDVNVGKVSDEICEEPAEGNPKFLFTTIHNSHL